MQRKTGESQFCESKLSKRSDLGGINDYLQDNHRDDNLFTVPEKYRSEASDNQ